MSRKRQLPPGTLLPCPDCGQWLYALRSPDGGMFAACTSCKFSAAPPAKGIEAPDEFEPFLAFAIRMSHASARDEDAPAALKAWAALARRYLKDFGTREPPKEPSVG